MLNVGLSNTLQQQFRAQPSASAKQFRQAPEDNAPKFSSNSLKANSSRLLDPVPGPMDVNMLIKLALQSPYKLLFGSWRTELQSNQPSLQSWLA